MRKLCLLSVGMVLCINVFSQISLFQVREPEEIYEPTDSLLKGVSMVVPEKYADFSAVGLANITAVTYEHKAGANIRVSVHRLLLKIQDIAARDKYSTFSVADQFYKKYGNIRIKSYAIRIIKPSGKVVEIDAEGLEENANDEIAIPNLEIGDIIDYGLMDFEWENKELGWGRVFLFSQIQTLTNEFPIVYGFSRFQVERKFFVNHKSLNGAPKLVLNEKLSDRKNHVYELHYHDIKPISDEVWAPIYLTEATTKLQVCYYPRSTDKAPMILGDSYSIKSSSTDKEKIRALKTKFDYTLHFRGNDHTRYFSKWLMRNFPRYEWTNDKYMNYAFYHYRFYQLVYSELSKSYQKDYSIKYIDEKSFVKLMTYTAKMRDIPCQAVFTCDKNVSTLDNVMLMSEFDLLIRYKNDADKWVYMSPPTSYQTTDYVGDEYGGQDAFAVDAEGNFHRIQIPETRPSENLFQLNFNIVPELDSKKAQVNVTTVATGIFKYNQSPFALKNVEYYLKAELAMLPEGKEDRLLMRRSAQRGMDESDDVLQHHKQEKLIYMKEIRSEDFDIDEYTDFKLINSGIKSADDSLKYRETYSLNNIVDKVGPNYVLNLSKVVFDQITFTEEEKNDRENDVYIDFPKTYSYTYRITIPEGYIAQGLDAYNELVDTPYGKVEMSAEQVGSEVIVKLTKTYKKTFVPKSDWPKFMEFLEPAMKMNDARLVLKKV